MGGYKYLMLAEGMASEAKLLVSFHTKYFFCPSVRMFIHHMIRKAANWKAVVNMEKI